MSTGEETLVCRRRDDSFDPRRVIPLEVSLVYVYVYVGVLRVHEEYDEGSRGC